MEFEDGRCLLEPQMAIRRAGRIAPRAVFAHLEVEARCRSGFFVHYDNGRVAEVSWSFIREQPPRRKGKATRRIADKSGGNLRPNRRPSTRPDLESASAQRHSTSAVMMIRRVCRLCRADAPTAVACL